MKYAAKTLSPVQVGQVVKALVLLGARKIIVEEVEKDRFVVTTTTETARISFRKSIQVQIDDEAALPADYVTTTVTTKPDKTAIKKAIQAGEDVTGASLVENRNIQIK